MISLLLLLASADLDRLSAATQSNGWSRSTQRISSAHTFRSGIPLGPTCLIDPIPLCDKWNWAASKNELRKISAVRSSTNGWGWVPVSTPILCFLGVDLIARFLSMLLSNLGSSFLAQEFNACAAWAEMKIRNWTNQDFWNEISIYVLYWILQYIATNLNRFIIYILLLRVYSRYDST